MEKRFIYPDEVAEILGVTKGSSYKYIRMLNEELKAKGLIVIQGRTDRNYFMKRFFTEESNDAGVQR
ncbi:MAG: hypothetical protein IJI83_04835 [Oscillospiraceae bacterium]|nr:hypothetical protein [Oscillospiraceae bacterium]